MQVLQGKGGEMNIYGNDDAWLGLIGSLRILAQAYGEGDYGTNIYSPTIGDGAAPVSNSSASDTQTSTSAVDGATPTEDVASDKPESTSATSLIEQPAQSLVVSTTRGFDASLLWVALTAALLVALIAIFLVRLRRRTKGHEHPDFTQYR